MPYADDYYGLDEFDEYEDDEYGASKRRVASLLKRKSKLEALLPVVRPARAKLVQARLNRIDRVLNRIGYTAEQSAISDEMAAAGVEGIGGLRFDAMAPPGLGRLVRLPFYPTVATAGVTTSGGAGVASTTNPVFIEAPAAGLTSNGVHALATPQISWAVLRIVGFETQLKVFRGIAAPGPLMVVSDLQIGGGANLFTHEDFADAEVYDADQPEFAGLRDYPVLKSPNVATVAVQMVDDVALETATFACAILAEVLIDDNYGAHVPGPYARKGALVRQGGSFV